MEFETWGTLYDPNNRDIPHSWDLECLKCSWRYHIGDHEHVVGFHPLTAYELVDPGSDKKVGVLIIECPQCFSKFWLHVRRFTAETIRQRSDKWPKPNAE